jgi:phosphate transport system substrate-binding protein
LNFKKYLLFLVIAALAFVVVACGTDKENNDKETNQVGNENTEETNNNDQAENDSGSADLDGSVVIDGSGTVFPLMSRLAEEYMLTEQEGVSVEVSRAGTSAGFEKFLVENGTDFNDASREIKDEEAATAEELGIEVKELKVALDGLTFVVHPDNDWATELTEEELISIFHADGGVTKWSDINPDFPDEEIQPYGPNENHGTYEFFWENILDKEDLVDTTNLQQEYSTLVTLISEDINGIAFFGFGYYVNNQDKLQAVSVDFGDGPVEPSLDTIAEDGDYAPFTRPVFTYLNVDHAKEKPQVLDYAIYAMNNINQFAGETGFAPIPDSEVQEYVDFLEGLK